MCTKNIIICFLLAPLSSFQSGPTVKTLLGEIRGHHKKLSNGNKYEAYEGIPYALPPIGNRRFMPPEPIGPWQRAYKADKFKDRCLGHGRAPEKRTYGTYLSGVEDCLYLNIYKPKKETNALLPVMVYIYGGGFQYSTLEGTEQNSVINHGVIFVSLNYRHGSLGFLSTEDEVVTGNMGLKDQAMALKWVSDNIEYFGGDRKKITITGQSAGGASVHYHYLSPMSKGLFWNGISWSGTAFDSWTQVENSRSKAIQLGKLMNCSIDDTFEMVKCLQTRPANSIVDSQAHFMPWMLNEFTPFGPVVEKYSKNPFIDRSPIDIINSGDAYDVPWITGVVSEEGLFPIAEFVTNRTAFEDLDKNWDSIAPHLLQYYYTIPKKDHAAVAQKIRKHYFGDKSITQENLRILVDLYSDRVFIVDAEKAARAQAKINKSPVRYYYYTYRATDSLSDYLSGTTKNLGVCHADDMLMFLKSSKVDFKKTANDFAMHKDLTSLWLSVVRHSVPKFGRKWKPIDSNDEKLNYLHIAGPNNSTEESNNNFREYKFWSTIDFNENKPSVNTL